MSRRAKITPEQVGLSPGVRRRVPGLRREEAAQLAGVSTEYYTQIERGNVAGVSDEVLQAISRALTQIVGELATQSIEFRTRWAAHNVAGHRHGVKQFCHPEFGDLTLTYNVFEITGAPGLSLVGYTAAPDTPSAHALNIMASWSVTSRT
ncbi:helix-turn-helix transcriptional regulator [Mycobacterium sp. TNTM28]|uniref:Helix-turn-helix transcriptional regulator n=1 Tax=[Mycobacterium] fortunisiensis TaxID=2600579 RepID=A0ABS6KST2_9MYCO|nr:helix-turn-helix domain-containing protein [[Mycobacterium] fortunisiensis]MBU9766549.1 helix-turn-helix transcriptional regulator [[Mycobacterium] fortunisiensis]